MNGRICPRCGRPYQSELVHRLRERIDVLLDQREALEQALAASRRRTNKLTGRIYELTRSRDLWRLRARNWRPVRTKAKR